MISPKKPLSLVGRTFLLGCVRYNPCVLITAPEGFSQGNDMWNVTAAKLGLGVVGRPPVGLSSSKGTF